MKIYTVIQYVFGQTKLIYSGINKELAYQILEANENNYLHVWEDDKEICYEGRGIDTSKYTDVLLDGSAFRTFRNRIEYTLSNIEIVDDIWEEDHLWLQCSLEDSDISFEIQFEKLIDNSVLLEFGCKTECQETLQETFNQIEQTLRDIVGNKYQWNKTGIITSRPLDYNPY